MSLSNSLDNKNPELVHVGRGNEETTDFYKDEKQDFYESGDYSDSNGSTPALADFTRDDVDAIVPTEDFDAPASTLRMWVLVIVLSTVIGGVDAFFNMRFPTIHIAALVAQVVAFPLGELWYWIVPSWNVPLPFGCGFNLNPGPFNQKEHALVFVVVNVVVSAGLVNNAVVEQFKFFDRDIGIGKMIMAHVSCFILSYALSGLTYDILVTPPDCVWPGILGNCALLQTFHSRENKPAGGWTISRFKFLAIVFTIAFVWYWFPDFIAPFLSTIGAWISWCKPSSAALSQVFGVQTGLGLFPLTFDWSQVTSLSNPLTTPFWAVCCVFGSFVFWIWIVMPGLYYQNHWQTAHLPIMTSSVFDVKGKPYNASKVVNQDWDLVTSKFNDYSPVMLPIAFLMNVALGLASFTAMMVTFFLRVKPDVIDPLRLKKTDVHNVALSKYKNFHWTYYVAWLIIGLAIGFGFSGAYSTNIDAGAFIVSIIIAVALYMPLIFIESRSSIEVSLQPFFEIIGAFWFKNPLKLFWFYTFGFSVLQHGMHTSMSAKLAHYNKVPPKVTMTCLLFAAIWGGVLNPAVTGYILYHFEGVCSADATNHLVCRKQKTQFNSQLVWGLFGDHIFTPGGRYSWVLWFFLVGGVVSLAIGLIQMWKPNSFWKRVNPTLLFAGAANIPSVTGYNVSTWAVCAAIMNFWVHRTRHAWWKKYNLVLAVGLDTGLAIAVILIYFSIFYTGASNNFTWWGTTVSKSGCDANGCPHLTGSMTTPLGW